MLMVLCVHLILDNTTLRAPVTTAAPSTQLPQAGGPLARDYALGRSSGAVQQMAAVQLQIV